LGGRTGPSVVRYLLAVSTNVSRLPANQVIGFDIHFLIVIGLNTLKLFMGS
jgi:hypothetical protein